MLLGGVSPDRAGGAVRSVIYRRLVEDGAAGRPVQADLVYEVVVEQVAELMGIEPDEVDEGRDEE